MPLDLGHSSIVSPRPILDSAWLWPTPTADPADLLPILHTPGAAAARDDRLGYPSSQFLTTVFIYNVCFSTNTNAVLFLNGGILLLWLSDFFVFRLAWTHEGRIWRVLLYKNVVSALFLSWAVLFVCIIGISYPLPFLCLQRQQLIFNTENMI